MCLQLNSPNLAAQLTPLEVKKSEYKATYDRVFTKFPNNFIVLFQNGLVKVIPVRPHWYEGLSQDQHFFSGVFFSRQRGSNASLLRKRKLSLSKAAEPRRETHLAAEITCLGNSLITHGSLSDDISLAVIIGGRCQTLCQSLATSPPPSASYLSPPPSRPTRAGRIRTDNTRWLGC